MSNPYQQVREFHKAFNHPTNDTPTPMDLETASTRSNWIIEEIVEFLYATTGGNKREFINAVAELHTGVDEAMGKELRENKVIDNILVAQADALTDISYFNYGSFTILGIEPQSLFDIVQNANMAKLGKDNKPIIRESDGKIMKPNGWQPPEPLIEKEIKNQILDHENGNTLHRLEVGTLDTSAIKVTQLVEDNEDLE